MYEAIDLPELDLGEAAVGHHRLFMQKWACGTSGCLIGTWCRNTRGDRLALMSGVPSLDGIICHDGGIGERFS